LSLLIPQADDPQDAVVAKQYMADNPTYIQTAKEWTRLYADPNKKDEKVSNQLVGKRL
jgi:ubiquitin-conjugating enzyme (huntingtin interacting protein 2)